MDLYMAFMRAQFELFKRANPCSHCCSSCTGGVDSAHSDTTVNWWKEFMDQPIIPPSEQKAEWPLNYLQQFRPAESKATLGEKEQQLVDKYLTKRNEFRKNIFKSTDKKHVWIQCSCHTTLKLRKAGTTFITDKSSSDVPNQIFHAGVNCVLEIDVNDYEDLTGEQIIQASNVDAIHANCILLCRLFWQLPMRLVMPRGKTVARGKGVKRRRTARVTDNDRTAALSQTEHDVVPPRTQITTSNASGPSTTFNSSVDLPNNEESYSQTINEQGTFQNFESKATPI
ncbi:unnamed protein product [Mytilus edulis]|uniref:Uncharacterized protein n=1 Tax=Mytilus edulis TaxID=6550 RepID=A0A8S3R803_MYTED|nr:unnamed protein product [Mytilus edulis]